MIKSGNLCKTGVRYRVVLIVSLLLAAGCTICGCGGEDPELSRKKLEVILKDDLKAIVSGVAPDAVISKPEYKVVFYKQYEKSDYSIKAVVDFYFLKSLKVKVVRKYRFAKSQGMWERYFNEYTSIPDTAASIRAQ